MDDLLRDFLTESIENLARADSEILKLEADPGNVDALQRVFRAIHTIKGTCGFVGLARLEKVAHAAESVLDKFRDGAIPLATASITLVLEAFDRMKEILNGIEQTEAEPDGDDTALISQLERVSANETSHIPAQPDDEQDGDAAETAEVTDQAPLGARNQDTEKSGAQRNTGDSIANQSIRVNVNVIEQLMVMVSELVLTRNQLLEMVRHLDNSEFRVPLQRLSNVTGELQESVMKTRLQPIGNAWAALPRIVRDLGAELGKKLELQMIGAETELDRQVLELIKDPLTHMVRNSGDHGIEFPEERRAANKRETGTIRLEAFHEGGHIIVQISDDGRGLSTEKIRQKALANGLATETELAKMTEAQIQRFIFHAGLSTASQVTSISGRGVGMDVVRSNIELIGGSIDLKSSWGRGTTFTIKIPLTMAIVSALVIGEQGMRFAIPQSCVVELVRIAEGSDTKIECINQAYVLRLRNRLLPLVRLSDVLGIERAEPEPEERYVIVAQAGGSTFGVIVDKVFDTGEIVVKPVSPVLKDISMYLGNTILGDGSVIMILDPNGLATAVAGEAVSRNGESALPHNSEAGEKKQSLLLFRAGSTEPKAISLGAVTRLELVDTSKIERVNGEYLLQYRGMLMPIVSTLAQEVRKEGGQPVIVFTDNDHAVGLAVDEIIDIIDAELKLQLAARQDGILGTAVISERATEIIDVSYHISDVFRSHFIGQPVAVGQKILVVDDSPFFRTTIAPLLASAGYEVTEASSAESALRMKDEGKVFDIILSDVSLPGLGAVEFASRIKNDPDWRNIPVVGLTNRNVEGIADRFDAIVRKYDRDEVLNIVKARMSRDARAA